jgi:type IV pilus assembly protein PilV
MNPGNSTRYSTAVRRRHRGFTVVEVLVALVVLSVGLLGIAKLMLFAARSNDSAYLRSQATALAYEMLDTMRANRSAAIAHAYDTPLGTAAAGASPCLAAACSAANLALYDVYTWKQRLAVGSLPVGTGALPNGTGQVVTATSTTSPAVTTAIITVQWDDQAAQASFAGTPVGTAANMQIVLQTIL